MRRPAPTLLVALLATFAAAGPPAFGQARSGDGHEGHDHAEDDPTHGGLLEAPEPDMQPEEVGVFAPAVTARDGAAEGLRVEIVRAPSEGFPGVRVRARVTNEGTEPRIVDAVVLTGGTAVRPWVPPAACRVLVLEGEGLDRCEVTPFRVARSSRRLVVVGLPDRRYSVVAGFPAPPAGVETSLTVTPGLALTFSIAAEVRCPDTRLAPGASFETPELSIEFAPEAWAGLAPFLAAEDEDLEPRGDDPEVATPLVAARGADGSLRLRRHPRGRALDLLEGDGRPRVWRLDSGDGREVELDDPDAEPRPVLLRFSDLALPAGEAVEVFADGVSLGLHRHAITVPLARGSATRLRCEAREDTTPSTSAWELIAVAPPEVGRPVTVERFDANDPAIAERLTHAFRYGGFVIANHRGTEVLEPLPPALAIRLAPDVFPVQAREVREPRGDEAKFLERASNVEWVLGVPRRASAEGPWLVAPSAGYDATPIEGAIVDGLPGARGFCVPTDPGLAILVLDLAPADLDALVTTLRSDDARTEVVRNVGRAMRTLRAGAPGGLFGLLPYERHAPIDLVPASGFSVQQWAVQFAADDKAVERRETVGGGEATEDVLLFTRPLVFALDVPMRPDGRVAVVVRRRASFTLDDWTLELDATALRDVRRATRPSPTGWIDEVVTFGAAEIRQRPRVAMVLRPIGGVMPLARVAFFEVPTLPGTPLHALPRGRVRTEGSVRQDLDADGYLLRMGDEAFLDGYGLSTGGAIEVDLDGSALSLLARVGIDADAPVGCRAALRISVDGVEQQVTEVLEAGAAPLPLTVPLGGARKLRIDVVSPRDGSDEGPRPLVDLVDARLVTR